MFTEAKQFPLVHKVLLDKTYGKAFRTDLFLFWLHQCDFGYVELSGEGAIRGLKNFFLKEKSLPQYFHLYNAEAALIKEIEQDNGFGCKNRKRVQLRYLKDSVEDVHRKVLEEGYSIKTVDHQNIDKLEPFGLDIFKKFWNTIDEFLDQAMPVLIDDSDGSAACLCYASTVVDQVAEVDIITLPEHRGKGLAKVSAEEFVSVCLRRGILPNWDCFEENLASLKTAQSLGFTRLREYQFLSVFIKN